MFIYFFSSQKDNRQHYGGYQREEDMEAVKGQGGQIYGDRSFDCGWGTQNAELYILKPI